MPDRVITTLSLRRPIGWLGLLALTLQLSFAPIASLRVVAMAIDPLADAALCLAAEDGRGLASPIAPPRHSGHCDPLCQAACASHTPLLAEQVFQLDRAAPATAQPEQIPAQALAEASHSSQQIRAPPHDL